MPLHEQPLFEVSRIYGAFYFTNNASVALRAYALGGTVGVGTALPPHGGLELFAIIAAAAGGLRMARGLLRSGWSSRRESFERAARESLSLALGAAVLLAVAGLIEGWIEFLARAVGAVRGARDLAANRVSPLQSQGLARWIERHDDIR